MNRSLRSLSFLFSRIHGLSALVYDHWRKALADESGLKIYLFSICFTVGFLSSSVCFSQSGKVSGTLIFEDGSPVAYATVAIQSLKKYSLSDESGRFEIPGTPYGTYQLEFSSIEIQKCSRSISINSPSVEQPFVVKRAEASVLGEVVVEGVTAKREIESTGFAVNVIETKKAALQSIQTNDLLNRTAGVKVRQNGGMGSAVDYNLNGMSGHAVRIFIDGIPISTYGESFSLNSIPPALIERIEVYKGVIPAHLATDALGGAINVVLKNDISNNLSASVSYGSFNTQQSHVSGRFRHSKTGFTLRASGFYNYSDNDYEIWGKFAKYIQPNGRIELIRARRFNDAYQSLGGQLEIGFTDVKWADQFLIGYNGSDDYNEIQHGTYMSIPYMGRFSENQSHVLSLNYRKRDFIAKGLELTFNGMLSDRSGVINDTVRWNYDWYGKKVIIGNRPLPKDKGAQQGAPTINHINRNISTFRAGLNYDMGKNHRIVLNHMFYEIDRRERDEMKSIVEREFIDTRYLQKNVSSLAYEMKAFDSRLKTNIFGKHYLQDIIKVDPEQREENGEKVRFDERKSSTKKNTGYGMALSYEVLPKIILLASAEKAVRMPEEREVFGDPAENMEENVALKAERSKNINLGFRSGPFRKGFHTVSFSGTGFLRDTRDKIVQKIEERPNDAVQTAPMVNLGMSKAKGFEVELSYTYNKTLNVMLNMSRFNSVFTQRYDEKGRQFRWYNKQLPNEPFFTINTTAQYSFKDLIQKNAILNLNYSFGFVERFYTNWLFDEYYRTPRQYIQDIGVNYVFPNNKFVVSADARNIFNRQAYDNYGVQKPGRAFYLKLNYTINNF